MALTEILMASKKWLFFVHGSVCDSLSQTKTNRAVLAKRFRKVNRAPIAYTWQWHSTAIRTAFEFRTSERVRNALLRQPQFA